ncbi:MAG TPA: hypothetical protein VN903_00835 [Polyangia bacterium]|nr:hypothetical protein [Polyangia bacterium]
MSDTEISIAPETGRSLVELESVIERGIQTFVEVGSALLEVRDRRLYRETHLTWDAYCRERWNLSRIHAHRLIEASEVGSMLPIGNTPSTESQARELARLKDEPEAVREVWAEVRAEHGDDVTAAEVRAAVDRRLGGIEPSARQTVVLQAIADAQHILDEPETEKALSALSRIRFWLYLAPEDVAEAAFEPAQDAPSYAELARWVGAVAAAIGARASGPRAVR